MMVTFVSECEKKSLPKTRRVLDAFANRIGSRTWQTTITEEGLQAVKSLLRSTASKNTAVSCHWIRSRSRSEFLWSVGNKNKFNIEGIVPVNYTNQENILKTDGVELKMENLYANTKKQPLDQHLFAVGYVSYQLIMQVLDNEKLASTAFVAGCLHDLGKIDTSFQNWILDKTKKKLDEDIPEEGQHIDKPGKFSFETHPRHNEISLLIYHLMDDQQNKTINTSNKNAIKHVLYWHHAKPIRKTELKVLDSVYQKLKKNVGDSFLSEMFHSSKAMLKAIDVIAEKYAEMPLSVAGMFLSKPDEDRIFNLESTLLPTYKQYSATNDDIKDYLINVIGNAENNLLRSAVITADRLISTLSQEQLTSHLQEKTLHHIVNHALQHESELRQNIQQCLQGFEARYPESERNNLQAGVAQQLAETKGVAVLSGAAGCGKTKIALEWAANTQASKIIWVCPRVQVCQGLVEDLTAVDYLPNTKIEINTGEFKFLYRSGGRQETAEGEEFSGDIVLTTIDQVINSITTHSKVTGLVEYMNAHVVFDEYHEYINMPAFNLLFAELVKCKSIQEKKAKALLVSATPNYHFVEELLQIHRDDIISMESFNQSLYNIQFRSFDEAVRDETNPLYQAQPKHTFVISNTATTAQLSFIENQNTEHAILLHGKYKKIDKQDLFDKVFASFKEKGSQAYDVLRSGPIVQASLNISCERMVTEFTHAENWLQRLGRLDRFGKNSEENVYITAVPKTLADGKQTGACARFLTRLNSLQSAKAWYAFLCDSLNNQPVTIAKVYDLYQQFYNNSAYRKVIEEDLKTALKRSVEVINSKLLDPVSMPSKKKPKDGVVKIKKHSLRGDNRFVQMAVCKVSDHNVINFPNEYAYSETDFEGDLTTSVDVICGFGDSKQNLLSFMAKKHHNIKKEAKKSYKDSVLLNEARSPETPIYLSYSPDDLKKIEGTAHANAIYYLIGNNQPIGAMQIDKLTTNA